MIKFVERKRWVFLGLPFTFTVYTVKEDLITVQKGFLNKKENDCYMYKVQDVELLRSLGERIFGLGTVKCYTGDTTDPELYLPHIRNAKEIKEAAHAEYAGHRGGRKRHGFGRNVSVGARKLKNGQSVFKAFSTQSGRALCSLYEENLLWNWI